MRLVLLVLSLVNITLQSVGVKTIPVNNEQIATVISIVFAVASAFAAYWKNNSFTAAAQAADAALCGEASIQFYNTDDAESDEWGCG